MTEEQEKDLLANVKSLTDHMTMVDEVFKKARLGRNMILVFECGESGLLYPGDYARNWGRPWGDGLGPNVVSESLQSNYYVAPPQIDRTINSIEQLMHPVGNSMAQMDAHLVDEEAAAELWAVPMHEDLFMKKRTPILYAKQLANPLSRISRFQGMSLQEAAWAISRQGGYR